MAEGRVTFTVHGIESDSDVQQISDELEKRDGVLGIDIDTEGQAEVLYDKDISWEEQVKEAVQDMGYEVE